MPTALAEGLAALVLLGVLAFAVTRPRDLPEAVAAVPGALLVTVLGVVPWRQAGHQVSAMLPTVVFLAAVLMLSHLCDREGLFAWAGDAVARRSGGRPVRLLALVFVMASLITAVLSLDATVVLLTPVVFATASRLGMRPTPHVYATTHLANSGSLLLPVSNLTNLIALSSAGLSFTRFAGLMALPWVVAVGVEFAVFVGFFEPDLSVHAEPRDAGEPPPVPAFAITALALTLAGFAVCSVVHVEPFWAALAGVLAITAKRLATGARTGEELAGLGRAANPWFLAFVLALAVVVAAVLDHGLGSALRHVMPHPARPLGAGLGGLVDLLWLTGLAALLANLVNNLPAVLVLAPLAAPLGPLAVLAVLIGVNIGPNITYVGSLATLLWRRILSAHDHDPELGVFTRLGLRTVPLALVGCTLALWLVGPLLT